MRIVITLTAIAAATCMCAAAPADQIRLAGAAPDVGHATQLAEANRKKSKLPCEGEHPPSYCKPNNGSSKPKAG